MIIDCARAGHIQRIIAGNLTLVGDISLSNGNRFRRLNAAGRGIG